jgi:uncharacterized DUF497 family protein
MYDDVVYKGKYIWYAHKNEINKQKHHISFEAATKVFDDPFVYEAYDIKNSVEEDRYKLTGLATGLVNGLYVTVSVTYRDTMIRIFSARKAEPPEVRSYNENLSRIFS